MLAASCSKTAPQKNLDNQNELQAKFDRYLKWSNDRLTPGQWIPDTDCDGLLFNSLWASIGGQANITAAQDDATLGKWYRSPDHNCYPDHSKSEISRDMLLGLSFWIYQTRRLEMISSLINYGRAHSDKFGLWIMGAGDLARTTIRPNLQDTFYGLQAALGIDADNKTIPQIWSYSAHGYQSHLQMLHIFLRRLIGQPESPITREILAYQAKLHQNNALLFAIIGEYKKAEKILMNQKYFPADRLPESKDRCGFYLWQRDQTSQDWLPCDENKTHSGVDFLFASAIILGKIR